MSRYATASEIFRFEICIFIYKWVDTKVVNWI